MPKSLDPPKPGLSCGFVSWKQDNHALTKTYQFPSLDSLNTFCIALLTQVHGQETQLSALELRLTCQVQVTVFCQTYQYEKEIIRLLESVESSYQDSKSATEPPTHISKRHSIWPWKNTG